MNAEITTHKSEYGYILDYDRDDWKFTPFCDVDFDFDMKMKLVMIKSSLPFRFDIDVVLQDKNKFNPLCYVAMMTISKEDNPSDWVYGDAIKIVNDMAETYGNIQVKSLPSKAMNTFPFKTTRHQAVYKIAQDETLHLDQYLIELKDVFVLTLVVSNPMNAEFARIMTTPMLKTIKPTPQPPKKITRDVTSQLYVWAGVIFVAIIVVIYVLMWTRRRYR
jgi:hypothetical protein